MQREQNSKMIQLFLMGKESESEEKIDLELKIYILDNDRKKLVFSLLFLTL